MDSRFSNISFDQISTPNLPRESLAPIDYPERMSLKGLSKDQASWWTTGVVYKPKFLPNDLVDKYVKARGELNQPGGWGYETPYMHVPELRELCLYKPLMDILKDLIGEPMGLHLNLTGWVSTERNWHKDQMLNPNYVGTKYIAAWLALDDIHPDSGPFQYVEGSHRWPHILRDGIFKFLTPEEQRDPGWPTKTQDWVSKIFFDEVLKRGADVTTYTPKKGDLLLWHSSLVHRGSAPRVPGMIRKSLIAHYSALSVRKDMPNRQKEYGGHYFVL